MRANSCSQNATAICRYPDCPGLISIKSIHRLLVSLAPVSVIRSNAHCTRSVRDSGHARHYPEKRGGNCLPCLIASYAHASVLKTYCECTRLDSRQCTKSVVFFFRRASSKVCHSLTMVFAHNSIIFIEQCTTPPLFDNFEVSRGT